MGERKSAAIVIAALAAVLVMLAGRGCAESIKRGQKNNTPANTTISNHAVQTDAETRNVTAPATVPGAVHPGVEYVTDILGRVIGTVENTTEVTEPVTEAQPEYVTDILGRVVKVIEPTTVPVQTTEKPTDNRNPLQKYQEEHSTAPVTRDADIESEHYTAPSTLQITIG
ncbi:MAG: hypothetical protein IKO47_10475 [Ruminococcus sp.]|nr:hypothetical protein [Ruminococcus sp.]